MKTNQLLFKLAMISLLFPASLCAQTVSTFENLNLSPNSFWNGSDRSHGFTSGNAFFTNFFDTTFGPYWEGFAASNTTNDSTRGYTNQYSAITAKGFGGSATYAVNYTGGIVRLTGAAQGKQVMGFY